jgi:hypothetical protein
MTEFDILRREILLRKERFIQRLLRHLRADGPCLLWTGAMRGGRVGPGYPTMNFGIGRSRRKCVDVHRIFLILQLGRPIRDKMEAGHYLCMNTRCVRHVREETRAQNLGELNGRRKKGADDGIPF